MIAPGQDARAAVTEPDGVRRRQDTTDAMDEHPGRAPIQPTARRPRTSLLTRRPWMFGALTLLAAAVFGLVVVSAAWAASSGSIVFIKKGNVWLASPDGHRIRQVTKGGGYASPSQADNGTIVALRHRKLVRLNRRGRRLGRPVPLVGSDTTHSGNLTVQAGPADLRVSPNGKLAAYWIGIMHQFCNPVSYLCDYRLQDDIIVTSTRRFTSHEKYGLVRDYREPSWASNELLVAFNYGLADTVAIDKIGDGDANLAPWFSDPQGVQLGKGQVAEHADVLAVAAGSNRAGAWQETLRLYAIQPGTEPPVGVCELFGADGGFTNPVWRPDGRALAWQQTDGIHVGAIPDLHDPAADCASITDRRISRGTDPHWGPKAVGRRDGLRR